MTVSDRNRIGEALERFFRESRGGGPIGEDPQTADFCFHMSDWLDDLLAYAELVQRPESADSERWHEVLFNLLCHASGHVLAATKLAGFDPVVFEALKGKHSAAR